MFSFGFFLLPLRCLRGVFFMLNLLQVLLSDEVLGSSVEPRVHCGFKRFVI